MGPIYLDHNATTPVLPEVAERVAWALREAWGNPSSDHLFGRRARAVVDDARAHVAALIGAASDEIVFTSGGTEASNLGIRGLICDRTTAARTAIEHPATVQPLAARFARVRVIPVDAEGRAQVAAWTVDADLALLCEMHANNETGEIQPVRALADHAHAGGARVLVDAAQSAGKIPVDVDELGADLLVIAGHKLYAPQGVGALYVRRGTPLAPFARGAGHERGLRPGTENVAGIAGLGEACRIALGDVGDTSARVEALRDRLRARLERAIPGLRVTGAASDRLPNTLHVRFPAATGSAILDRAPEVAASTGSACHAGVEQASNVLLAMGIDPSDALGAVRLTLGRSTTAGEVDVAADALERAWRARD
jgi:cysteine desulfurase